MKLCFDCDDTLYDLSFPFRKAAFDVLGLDATYELDKMYVTYRACGDEIFDQVQNGTISIDESGIYRIKKMCELFDINVNQDTCIQFQKVYKEFQHKIFMPSILHDFFENTTDELAILTNGQDKHQRMKLEVLDVFKYFKKENVFTSGQLGYAKPEKEAFLKMFDLMHENAEDWYYIGDNYINDMEGAKSVGMKTIHINRHHGKEGNASDHVVYDEKELVDLLRSL